MYNTLKTLFRAAPSSIGYCKAFSKGVLRPLSAFPLPMPKGNAVFISVPKSGDGAALSSRLSLPSPLPYIRYCTPRNASQPAWKIPHSLNAHGISVVEVKNQNIFIASPASQLASTDTRKPLQERDRALANIWGSGSVASTDRPI